MCSTYVHNSPPASAQPPTQPAQPTNQPHPHLEVAVQLITDTVSWEVVKPTRLGNLPRTAAAAVHPQRSEHLPQQAPHKPQRPQLAACCVCGMQLALN